MSARLKRALLISAKNAVNALLTNTAMTALFPHFMQWHHPANFWWNVGKVALATVIGREAIFWGPKLLRWSETNGE